MIIFLNYCFNDNYKLFLAQKIKKEAWFSIEKKYNEKYQQNKNFGEFCYRFKGDEIKEGKIRLTFEDKDIRGTAYFDNNIYKSTINPETLDLKNEKSNWDWKWYNWLGIKIKNF